MAEKELQNQEEIMDQDQPKEKEEEKAKTEEKSEAKYSDKEVDAIIDKKFAEWQKKQEEAVREAEELATMTAEEKKDYDLQQLQKKIDELEKRENHYQLTEKATLLLAENDIKADSGLLSMVVRDNEEATEEAVTSFVDLVNQRVEEGVKQALRGSKPPKGSGKTNAGVTRESILAIEDREKRQEAIKENRHLFK